MSTLRGGLGNWGWGWRWGRGRGCHVLTPDAEYTFITKIKITVQQMAGCNFCIATNNH
jgi:hypothetical protein